MMTDNQYSDFMNTLGEVSVKRSVVVRSKVLRNMSMEIRNVEQNRERAIMSVMLAGTLLLLYALI